MTWRLCFSIRRGWKEKMYYFIQKQARTHRYDPHWKFCVGSGHAPLALRTDYVRMLKQVHEELGIQYVRFHGIFSDDMDVVRKLSDIRPGKGCERFTEWNFHKIGLAYDNVLECGMKPFVELSFMPKALASGEKQCMLYYKGNNTPPRDYAEWAVFIQKFVNYLIHRYGEEEVRTWYFEVWNEPDLPIFFSGSKADYYQIYDVTAKAVKSVDQKLSVGGPATAGSKWVKSFLAYCTEHQIPVDFVSTHQYAGDPIGGIDSSVDLEEEYPPLPPAKMDCTELLKDLEDGTVLDAFRRLMPDKSELTELSPHGFVTNAKVVRQQAGKLPLFYTEWNENAIFSAESNDTRKVAAYDLKAVLDTEGIIDASSVWCFSDLFEEFHHFPEEFHGGFGLLTSNGIPKPVYHMFKLLGSVAENRIDLGEKATEGEIGVAAFKNDVSMQVFLFRQKMTNWERPDESLVLEVETAQQPRAVRVRKIDEEHGNPYRLWKEMGSPQDLTRQEVDQIKQQSALVIEDVPYEYSEGKIKLTAKMGVNDIWFIEIDW